MIAIMNEMIGAAVRAIWNGPFHVGRLSSPVSLGDAVMKILETSWRAAIVLSAVIAMTFLTALTWDLRPKQPEPTPLFQQIRTLSRIGAPMCNSSYPLHVVLKNTSAENVARVSFTVAAYAPGRSTNLVAFGTGEHVSDYIVPAGRMHMSCWPAPTLVEDHQLDELSYVVTVTDAEAVRAE